MNTDILLQKIKNPHLIEQTDIALLKNLSDKYPFTQLYPILYLKALSLHKNLLFEDELKNYAYRITDRTKLYDLIYSFETSTSSVSYEEEAFVSDEIVIEEEVKIESIAPEVETVEEILTKETVVENEEHIEFETTEKASNEAVNVAHEDFLEKEILSNIIASSYSLEMEQSVDEEIQETKTPHVDIHESRSFSSWLSIPSEKTSESITVSKKIIDDFIQNEKPIEKPKTEFYSAPKKAKESVSDDRLIYTETLANIFALQGNYPKAIVAFEQLKLTSPERADFFEQKIKEFKKKIN
ncbi:MAG: hypothetical protein V4622_04510 [Bacteroidota bacterium]